MDFSSLISKGGPVLYILLVLSVVGLTIALIKFYQFSKCRLYSKEFVDDVDALLRKGEVTKASAILAAHPSPTARVLESAIKVCTENNRCREDMEAEVARVGSAQIRDLEALLRGLGSIAHLSPLLGLLGTVLGMITAFQKLEGAGSQVNPALLAGGIWEALLTTAVGLCIAIPSMAVYYYFEGEVDKVSSRMKDGAVRVFAIFNCHYCEGKETVSLVRERSNA